MEPKLKATFDLDETGRPRRLRGTSREHYVIRLSLADVPGDVYSARYKLDPSYRNPIREVFVSVPAFEEPITAYGDYRVSVELQGRETRRVVESMLSEALERSYGAEPSGPVRQAIEAIKRS